MNARATVGESFSQRVVFDVKAIRDFAALTGDFNPLHHDEAAAARSPFGSLIVGGPHVSALMMGMTATHFCKRCAPLGLEFTIRFVRAISAGTALELRWTLTDLTPKGSLRGGSSWPPRRSSTRPASPHDQRAWVQRVAHFSDPAGRLVEVWSPLS